MGGFHAFNPSPTPSSVTTHRALWAALPLGGHTTPKGVLKVWCEPSCGSRGVGPERPAWV